MRFLYSLFFLLLITFNTFSAGVDDKVVSQLLTVTSDTAKVDSLNKLSASQQWSDPDLAMDYANQAFALASKLSYREGVKYALRRMGYVYDIQGNHTRALESFLSSLKLETDGKNELSRAHAMSSVGQSYTQLGNYDLADEYLKNSLAIFQRLGSQLGIGISYRRIGNLLQTRGENKKALDYYQRSFKIMKLLNDYPGMALVLDNIGSIEKENGNFDRAIALYRESLEIKQKNLNKIGIATTFSNIGEIYMQQNDYPTAISYYERALEVAKKFALLETSAKAYLLLSNLYRKSNNYTKAYNYLQKHLEVKDALFNKERLKQLSQMQSNIESITQQKEIEILKQQKKLQEATLKQNQSLIGFWVACFALVSLLIVVVFIAYRINKRDNVLLQAQNSEITKQKQEIEAQNVEIQDNNNKLESARVIIEDQNNALRRVNSELEEKVDQRTKQLTQAYVDLLTVNQDLDTLIYRASHDIKGPLATLIGLCNVALIDVKDQNALDYFSKVDITARNMDRILMRLLSINNIRLGNVMKREIDFEKIVNNTLQTLMPQSDPKHTLVYVRIQPNLSFVSDESLLRIIIQNLLENALFYSGNFTRQDSCVQVNVMNDEVNNIVIHIKDNGVGIAEVTSEKVFNMFYKGNEVSQGAGLGLYIAKIATEKLNGTIALKNKNRGETLFEVKLPR